jgi:predicted transcriptional regulator YdeE
MIQPSALVQKERLVLAGMSFFGDPFQFSGDWSEENEIGHLWKRYLNFRGSPIPTAQVLLHPEVSYEMHLWNTETQQKGFYEVFVGQEVQDALDIPLELSCKVLPACQYAIFTLQGQQIIDDWPKWIYQEWLPTSGYREAYPFLLQCYDPRFKSLKDLDNSILEVQIPIR